MKPRIGLRPAMAVLAVAAAVSAASATPVPDAPAVEPPRTGHQHVAGRGTVRWCLADGPPALEACMAMCHAGEIDVVVIQGSRFGLPTYNPLECSFLEHMEGEGA